MSGDPTSDPNFTGVKQPAFDALVTGHARAAGQLDQLATDLWAQLTRLGIDTGPAMRIRGLALRTRQESTDLQRRQRQVHELERGGGPGFCVPSGTFWELEEPKTPQPRPGPPVRDPVLQPAGRNLSWELQSAMYLPAPYVPAGASLDSFSPEEKAVMSWIQANRETILREAKARNIPPEAIVAAISWEALENPQFHPKIPAIPVQVPGVGYLPAHQSTGPGKVHIDTDVVRQIESRGYLPSRNLWERQLILSTPEGSIKYIAAIMGAFADVTDEHAAQDHSIRDDVPMLAQLYQGSDLDSWERDLIHHPKYAGDKYDPENPMAIWAGQHSDFLRVAMLAPDGTGPPAVIPGLIVGPPPPHLPTPGPGARPTPP